MSARGAAASAVALAAAACMLAGAAAWQAADARHDWSFPRDHWPHRGYRVEWWYLTGHLESTSRPPRRFGYQLTLFRVGLMPAADDAQPDRSRSDWAATSLVMGHAAITDVDSGEHRFAELLYREMPMLAAFGTFPDPLIAWSRAPAGTDGRWELGWDGSGFVLSARDDRSGIALALTTRPAKPLVLQGPAGLSRKGPDPSAASLYYSFTRLATRGSVTVGGRTLAVAGTSWMDHEFSSSSLGPGQQGWDWFSVQLADGRDLMLYVMRGGAGVADHASGTLIASDGRPTHLAPGAFSVTPLGSWKSAASGATYPSGWRVELPSAALAFDVIPRPAAQENCSRLVPRLAYWEGAADVVGRDGRALGRAYVELTGYAAGSRPPT